MAESSEQVEKVSDLQIAELAVQVARLAAPIFRERGWTYSRGWGKDQERFVPTEDDLAWTVSRILANRRGRSEGSTSSGHFTVLSNHDDGEETLSVELELGSVTAVSTQQPQPQKEASP